MSRTAPHSFRRGGGPPKRRVTSDAVRRDILAFVEGAQTEERYLIDVARRNRERVLLTVDDFHGGPLQLVQAAVARKKIDAREAKRGKGRARDELWCVFDIDEHPRLSDAISLAKDHEINLAISNPCIELWFIIHFEDRTAHIERHDAQRRSAELLGCAKRLTGDALDLLANAVDAAIGRANALDEKHALDGSPSGSNPSSGLRHLLTTLMAG